MAGILIFDSGVGGLTVSAEIRARLPGVSQAYVADDTFRPYGEKPESALRQRLPGLLKTLEIMINPDVMVLACNTASTAALAQIRSAVKTPVVGVVPAIKPAAAASRSRVIGVLGTPGTVRHKYVDSLIEEFAKDCEIRLCGSTALVAQAERKLSEEEVSPDVIAAEIAPLFKSEDGPGPDQIVLACTHFPLLREDLAVAAPNAVDWVDSGAAIARRVESLLGGAAYENDGAPDIAFLIGPDTTVKRRAGFARFGFDRVIGLMPG